MEWSWLPRASHLLTYSRLPMPDVQKKVGTGSLLGVCESLPMPAPTPSTLTWFPTKFTARMHLQPGKAWLG